MPYQPIEELRRGRKFAYDGRWSAKNGSIDWFCFPHFDSARVFSAPFSTERKGGYWSVIAPVVDEATTQASSIGPDHGYVAGLRALLSAGGVGEIVRFHAARRIQGHPAIVAV